jgi:hypothetical protein
LCIGLYFLLAQFFASYDTASVKVNHNFHRAERAARRAKHAHIQAGIQAMNKIVTEFVAGKLPATESSYAPVTHAVRYTVRIEPLPRVRDARTGQTVTRFALIKSKLLPVFDFVTGRDVGEIECCPKTLARGMLSEMRAAFDSVR